MCDFHPPYMTKIDDVLPFINGNDNFGVMSRGPFVILNYLYQDKDTFTGEGAHFKRECRGLVFDRRSGLILNRRFHKFFNVGENPAVAESALAWDAPHVVMDKLDGSMVSPVAVDGDLNHIRWITRMGITDTSMRTEVFVAKHREYNRFAAAILALRQTPIFEWTSPEDRIVIDYGKPNLTLLAIRDNYTGQYESHGDVAEQARFYDIPSVFASTYAVTDSSAFLQDARDSDDREGYVIQFHTGEMVKVKSDWYLNLHRCKEKTRKKRHIIRACIDDSLDDVITVLPDEDRKRCEDIRSKFWSDVLMRESVIAVLVHHYKTRMSRAEFARTESMKYDKNTRSLIFACWDGNVDPRQAILRAVEKTLQRDKRFEEDYASVIGDIESD